MPKDPVAVFPATTPRIERRALTSYIEDMLLQLAELASDAGETALAASLALTAIQAGAARERSAQPPVRAAV